jgi:two-component system OmpR family response regulator
MPRSLQTILYVDDEPHIREVVQLAIELQSDWRITTCDSGRSALAEMGRVLPDVVILDNMMPDMDGPAILEAIRARPEWSGLPVIFMTAKTLPQEVARLMQLGAVGVIGKPFDPMTLCNQLRALLNDGRH